MSGDCPRPKIIEDWFGKSKVALIVLESKYNKSYIVAKSVTGFYRFFLKLLRERMESGNYYSNPSKDEPLLAPPVSREDAKKLPCGNIRRVALAEWDQYDENMKGYEEAKLEWEQMNKALDENNGKLAYEALSLRAISGCEYEGMDVFSPEIAE